MREGQRVWNRSQRPYDLDELVVGLPGKGTFQNPTK